jgi:hypothetical protein
MQEEDGEEARSFARCARGSVLIEFHSVPPFLPINPIVTVPVEVIKLRAECGR